MLSAAEHSMLEHVMLVGNVQQGLSAVISDQREKMPAARPQVSVIMCEGGSCQWQGTSAPQHD